MSTNTKRATMLGPQERIALDYFGRIVSDGFGGEEIAYLVGSVLHDRQYRDVDVRIILSDDHFKALYGDLHPDWADPHWGAVCMAWSALGRQITGLPIDFQVQSMAEANYNPANKGQRAAIGITGGPGVGGDTEAGR